jgi:ABC-type amino acid transport substrate-binding protein
MPRTRTLAAAALLLLALAAIPAQAAPNATSPWGHPSVVLLLDCFEKFRDTLTAWIGSEGAGVDPFGNHATPPPPPDGSGTDPFGNHAGSDIGRPWGEV